MSWFSKVAWKEGLFRQPRQLPQADLYRKNLPPARTGVITPCPRGVAQMTDDTIPPPALVLAAHHRVPGWLTRVICWVKARLAGLAGLAGERATFDNGRAIRLLRADVCFRLKQDAALWREFSAAPAIGLHVTGDWPGPRLGPWAIPEKT